MVNVINLNKLADNCQDSQNVDCVSSWVPHLLKGFTCFFIANALMLTEIRPSDVCNHFHVSQWCDFTIPKSTDFKFNFESLIAFGPATLNNQKKSRGRTASRVRTQDRKKKMCISDRKITFYIEL